VIGYGHTAAIKSVEWTERGYLYKLQGLSDKTFLEEGFDPKAIAREMKLAPELEWEWLERDGEVLTPFLKTNGNGWGFTDKEAEAAVLSTETKAKELAARLKKQHLPQHIWEVLPCEKGYCIRVTSPKASRAGK